MIKFTDSGIMDCLCQLNPNKDNIFWRFYSKEKKYTDTRPFNANVLNIHCLSLSLAETSFSTDRYFYCVAEKLKSVCNTMKGRCGMRAWQPCFDNVSSENEILSNTSRHIKKLLFSRSQSKRLQSHKRNAFSCLTYFIESVPIHDFHHIWSNGP